MHSTRPQRQHSFFLLHQAIPNMKCSRDSGRYLAIRPGGLPVLKNQSGLTLVELLVALVISTVIAIAAVSALIVSRQGFTTVDSASQLRDNARFATDLIQRLGVQAGYLDFNSLEKNGSTETRDPTITGFNNALADATDPLNTLNTRTAGSVGYGSDVLILRYQAASLHPELGVTVPPQLSDKSMIDCSGNTSANAPSGLNDVMVSILHLAVSQGEPSLMCTTQLPVGFSTPQPIVRGVENFQVLYGVDGVIPNTAPSGTAATDSIASRYLRADQMVVSGDPVGTNANWRRVRSLRIGMVLRGPLGSAQETVARTFYPLGQAKDSSTGTTGSAMSSANDPGTLFSPGADNRMRQTVTFTVHLRNEQGL